MYESWIVAHLTRWGRLTHTCVSKLFIIGAYSAPIHYLNCTWISPIVYLETNFGDIWIKDQQENTIENIVCEMAAILCRPQCVKETLTPKTLISHHHWLKLTRCHGKGGAPSHLTSIYIYICIYMYIYIYIYCCGQYEYYINDVIRSHIGD